MSILKHSYLTPRLCSIFKSTMHQSRSLSTAVDDVLVSTVNNTGILQLNRPKVLNSLNLSMVNKMHDALREWENSKQMVIVSGTGGKAFCAGGDVKKVAEAGLRGESYGRDFFRREYILNGIIGTYPIPYVALVDGIVMGGGVGVSIHGHVRVATEKTLFAMPETRIGLFPDVGGSYFLPRLGGRLGYYLALTGNRLKGSDVYKAGIATHYCKSSDIEELRNALTNTCNNAEDIKSVLKKFHVDDQVPFSLDPYLEKINKYFSLPTMEAIVEALEQDGSDWAKSTIETLGQMSPTSLKVTLKELNLGKNLDLHECLRMEYRLAVNCLANKDFYEGIRALLVDKDNQPKWDPSKLTEVSDATVNSYFKELPKLEELQHKL